MSKDIARLIVDTLKADKSLDGLELKQLYKKKVETDTYLLKSQLKDIVEDYIKTHRQPLECFITLHDGVIPGGNCATVYKNSGEHNDKLYVLDVVNHKDVVVNNESSKQLIRDAIIPLDLDYSLEYVGNDKCIKISWSHWDK